MWTEIMDMHSGGDLKFPPYEFIYIESPEREAEIIFYNRFHHNLNHVTCNCCGSDYAVHSGHRSLKDATAFQRGCKFNQEKKRYIEEPADYVQKLIPLNEYIKLPSILIIEKSQITDRDRRPI